MRCRSLVVALVALVVPALSVPVAAADAPPPPTAVERTCRGEVATIVGTAGDDRLTGTRGRDVVVARGGDDEVSGLSGDDVLCGNGGADDLDGGPGDDQLLGGRDGYEERPRRTVVSGDHLWGGAGDDHLDVGFDALPDRVVIRGRNTVDYGDGGRGVTVDLAAGTASGQGVDTLTPGRWLQVLGSRHDDVLRGSSRPEILDGARGDDELLGGGGQDVVLGYRGSDRLLGGADGDLVISGAGRSTVDGGEGPDWLIAFGAAPATLLGGSGADYLSRTITGGITGVIDGGADPDQLELVDLVWFDRDHSAALDAGAGTAVLTAGQDTETVAFTSIDTFTLWGPRWSFLGTGADDFVQVLDGSLDARGLAGDDVFLGAERDDVLDGGEGTDTAWGGTGRNTCLDTEQGDCDGYPWDAPVTRGRVVERGTASPAQLPPHRLVSRWVDGRAPSGG